MWSPMRFTRPGAKNVLMGPPAAASPNSRSKASRTCVRSRNALPLCRPIGNQHRIITVFQQSRHHGGATFATLASTSTACEPSSAPRGERTDMSELSSAPEYGEAALEVDPFGEPTKRVTKSMMIVLGLANLGIWTAFFAPIQFLLPLQVEAIAPSTKESSLTLVLTMGAFVSLVASPIAGALSDRTTSRLGRRRPWVLWPSVAACAVLAIMGGLTIIGGLALGWALAQLTLNASYAAVTAILPDQIPVDQRGTASAIVGVAQPLGVVVGAIIATAVPGDNLAANGQFMRFAVVAAILILTAALFVFRIKDPQLDKSRVPPMNWGKFVRDFWVSPKEHPDFAWVWFTRFLVILGTTFVTSYLLYFTRDVLGKSAEEAPDVMRNILVVYILVLTVATIVVGPLSDKAGKVKPFVIGASVVAAAAIALLAFSHTVTMAMIAAALMAIGYGAYTAVDLALVSRVLPNAEDRARDLGVINIANALPQVLAPVVCGAVITGLKGQGYDTAYMVLYLLGAVICLLGAILVVKVKSVP
ncbi:MAG: MFS transporter [Actinobacteria bacterium]|nr:MAG: MFS transporter [Actinomycetota bacterium]